MDINTAFSELSADALAAYAVEVRTAFDALIADENPTDEQIVEAEALAVHLEALATEVLDREAAATKRAETLATLRTRFAEDDVEVVEPDEEPAVEETAAVPPAETEEERKAREAKEAQDAKPAASAVKTLAQRTKRPVAPANTRKAITITAASDVPHFSAGQALTGLDEVAKAVINRAKGFAPPNGNGETVSLQQFGTAMFALDFEDDLIVDRMDDAQEVMFRAADESRLSGNSLVAAGGWCAPSETVYDLSQDATTEGMLSLPEVAVKRGGIRYAMSPTFADFYANPGFIQTEAQAIAGTTKPCVEVDCPDFVEVRLDAEGICIKVPILTNAAYPEVVRNFIAGTLVAHQHWINANVIGRLVTFAGAARVFAGYGSTTSDTLEALELVINQRRQKYRLSMNKSMEVIVPFWIKGALRADIGRRTGRGAGAVSDAEINAWFASVNAAVQFVYDWQNIDESAEVYPATYQALVYPAGTFVKGTSDVISLNTVYDAASLQQNIYTGLFAEQGLLVAQMKFGADLITLPICNAGRQGDLNITCA